MRKNLLLCAIATLIFSVNANSQNKQTEGGKLSKFSPTFDRTITPSHSVDISENKAMWDIAFAFNATAASHVGIETDGTNFYTCAWNSGNFGRYNMDGSFVELFTISGVSEIRDLTYDGTYFYGSNAAMTIYIMDLANETLIGTIPVTCSGVTGVRHIAYDPTLDSGNGGFWIGNWNELGAVSMTGAQLVASTVTLESCYGIAYDPYSDPANPCLWLFQQPTGSEAILYQFDINTYSMTGVTHDCADAPGYVAGSFSAGACTYEESGIAYIAANIQQDPNLIVVYELAVTDLTLTDFTDYSIPEQTAAVIDDVNHTIAVEVGFGTDVTALVADFELSYAATAAVSGTPQVSGTTPNDFTTLSVTYTVTSGDLSVTQDWVVTVTVAAVYTETEILTFSFDEQTGAAVIDDVNYTVTIEVEYGTDPTNLIAEYNLSYGATALVAAVPQTSGVTANDFSSDVVYHIVAEDAVTYQDWTVIVNEEVIPVGEICLTAFNYGTINDPAQAGSIVSGGAYWYSVTFPNSVENVVFSLCNGTEFDSKIEIWDECNSAAYLYYNDDECGLQSEITVVSMEAGTYYVKVYGYGSSDFGNYSLNITGELLLGPQVETLLPADLATDVALDAVVSVTFTDNITEVDLTGITITPNPGNVTPSIVDNVLTIAHDAFLFNTLYTVLIPAGAVSDGVDNLVEDIEWSFTSELDPAACNDPSDIIISDIETFSATVSWTENGAGTEWTVLYGPTGFDPLTEGDQVSVTTDPTTILEELTADTEYDVYVQAICGVETSGWAGPVSFTTLYDCSTIVGLDEGFELQVAPLCWENYQAGAGTNVWAQETVIFNNGAASAAAYYQSSAGVNVQWLVTHEVNVPENYRLMFYVRDYYSTDYLSTLTIKVSNDDGATFNNLLTLAETDVTNAAFTPFNIDLSLYTGQDVKFAFVMTDDDGDSWYLDDVKLDFYNGVENNSNNLITVYPNPSTGLVNIAVTENSVVSVVDIAGRSVATFNVNANEEVNFTQSAGMYFVKVESNGKVSTHKLVIE